PGKDGERIVFPVGVVQELALGVRIAGIERNLIEVAARLSDEANLILRGCVVDKRGEAAEAVGVVVNHCCSRCVEAKIAAVSVKAPIVGEAVGMSAKVELIVALVKIAGGEN